MSNRKTKEQFIEKAIEIHGDKYEYSKVEYETRHKKIILICKEHGEFNQEAGSHLLGSGCKKCYNKTRGESQKRNMNDFIKKAKEKHGDKYDYSKVEYVNSKTKVIIICEEHGEFLQTPTDHYNGGCKKCADMLRNETRRFTIEELVQKAKEIHGDKYDYSNAQYDGKKINNINCKIHGKFKQSMDVHINRKGGCKKCGDILRGKNRMFTTEEFIKKSIEKHGDKYDYSKVEYNGTYNKIIIICREHGEFLQTPTSHIRGCGCSLCSNKTEGILCEKLQLTYPTIITQFKQD